MHASLVTRFHTLFLALTLSATMAATAAEPTNTATADSSDVATHVTNPAWPPTAVSNAPAALVDPADARSVPSATNQAHALTPASPSSTGSPGAPIPNVAGSFVRVMAMLALVLALFLGGVWVFRNWQRLTLPRGQAPRLNVLETRSLGGRHALLVVGYENERFLVASSPAGINLLTHLQPAEENETATAPGTVSSTEKPQPPSAPVPAFAATLAQMLKGKRS